jgi:hypothetical protein
LGLADALGDVRSDLRARYGDKVRTPVISSDRGWLSRKIPGLSLGKTQGLGAGLADDLVSAFEARALWSHYGL